MAANNYCCKPMDKTFRLYEQSWYVDQMDSVRDWLKAAVPDALTPRPEVEQDKALQILWQESPKECSRFLAKLSTALQQALDVLFGKEAPPERQSKITKFPARTFLDFKGAGGLCLMLRSTLRLRTRMSWPFSSLQNKITNAGDESAQDFKISDWASFFSSMERELVENNVIRRPIVVFSAEWERQDLLFEKMQLTSVIKKHKGLVVQSLDKATHIIVPNPPSSEDKGILAGKYHMVVEEQPEISLVHWWYYPDSYDDWLPKADFPEESGRRFPRNGFVWRVSAKWISDSTTFNEWMNELDYEVAEAVPQLPSVPMPPVPPMPSTPSVPSMPRNIESELRHPSVHARHVQSAADEADARHQETIAQENEAMQTKKKSSKYKGVFYDTVKAVWMAHCYVPSQGKRFIGDFKSEEEAARAYDRAALQNLGHKRASINFNREDYSELIQELRERDIKLGKDPDRHMGIGEEAMQSKRQKKFVRQGSGHGGQASSTVHDSSYPSSFAPNSQAMAAPIIKTIQQSNVQTVVPPVVHAIPQPVNPAPVQPNVPMVYQQTSQPAVAQQVVHSNVQQIQTIPQSIQQTFVQPPSQALAHTLGQPVMHTLTAQDMRTPNSYYHQSVPLTPSLATPVQAHVQYPQTPKATPSATIVPDAQQPNPCPPNVCVARLFSSKVLALKDAELEHWRSEPIVLPSYSSWFQLGLVHSIEKRSLPEFFTSDADTTNYIVTRDKMVELYRDYPHKLLLASDCIRQVAGDAATIFRLHAFLEQWGLINFEADGRVRFSKTMWNLKSPQMPGLVCAVTGAPIERVRYTSYKAPDLHISPTAYVAGLFPPNMVASDFVRTVSVDFHPHSLPSYVDWTEEETFRLLEAIDRCGDDWDMVAQYVGGKSLEQCAVHFARLPIFDKYIEDVCPTTASASGPSRMMFPADPSFKQLSSVLSGLMSLANDELSSKAHEAAAAVLEGRLNADRQAECLDHIRQDECDLPFYTAADQSYPAEYCSWARNDSWANAIKWPRMGSAAPECSVGALVVFTAWTPEGPMPRRGCISGGPNEFELFLVEVCCSGFPWEQPVVTKSAGELRVLSSDEVEAIEGALGGPFTEVYSCDLDDQIDGDDEQSVTDYLPTSIDGIPDEHTSLNDDVKECGVPHERHHGSQNISASTRQADGIEVRSFPSERNDLCAAPAGLRDPLAGDFLLNAEASRAFWTANKERRIEEGQGATAGSRERNTQITGLNETEMLRVKAALARAAMRIDDFELLSAIARELRSARRKVARPTS